MQSVSGKYVTLGQTYELRRVTVKNMMQIITEFEYLCTMLKGRQEHAKTHFSPEGPLFPNHRDQSTLYLSAYSFINPELRSTTPRILLENRICMVNGASVAGRKRLIRSITSITIPDTPALQAGYGGAIAIKFESHYANGRDFSKLVAPVGRIRF